MRIAGRSLISVVFFIFHQTLFAQTEPAFGIFTGAEIDMKECSFDKDADAVILFDRAVTNYDDQYRMITERRVRMKILREKGIERGNIRIIFQSANNFENITRIKAVVATPDENNRLVTKTLDNKSVYTRKINNYYSEVSFALPDVKVGSLIEYGYESVMEHYGGLQDWYFQSDLPVMLSAYTIYMVPNAEFTYFIRKSHHLPVKVEPDRATGRIYFEMKNIPGLRDEAFSSSYRNYLQRIDFQLSAIVRNGTVIKYNTTWKEMTRELLDERDFGGQLNKGLSGTSDLKLALALAKTPFEKMNQVFNYVRSQISWDGIQNKYASNGLKSVLEKKKGTSGDLNLLLVNLLRSADLDAYPLLVSERSHGKVDTTYPYLGQFNKVVAYVELEGKKYFLDATDYYTPVNMIPSELLNTVGYVIDKKRQGFVYITDNSKKRNYLLHLSSRITPAGTVEGTAALSLFDYARVGRAAAYKTNKAAYLEKLVKPYPDLKVDSFHVENLDTDSLGLVHHLQFRQNLGKSGNYYLLHYNFFTGFDKNPFVSAYRFTDIDFGTRYSCNLFTSFTLPDNLVPESLPKDMRLVVPGNHFVAIRETKKEGNELKVNLRLEINATEVSAESYEAVKEFFKKMVDMLNEPVLLKAKS